MSRFLFISLFLVCAINHDVFGQNLEGSHWYFGQQAGLNFSSGLPVADTNNAFLANNATATYSSALGDLLFYTNGFFIRDSLHQVTPNSSANILAPLNTVLGNLFSVKRPLNDSIYDVVLVRNSFVFQDELMAFTIDMSLNGGNGDYVPNSRDTLDTNLHRGIACLDHQNGTDKWVLMHDTGGAFFKSFLLDSSGIQLINPVASSSGNAMGASEARKIISSPNSELIALCFDGSVSNEERIELHKFNKTTGQVDSIIFSDTIFNSVLSTSDEVLNASFSSNSKVLYVGTRSRIVKYNLAALNGSSIINSKTVLVQDTTSTSTPNTFRDLQLGIDGKIYVLDDRYNSNPAPCCYLSAIECANDFINSYYVDSVVNLLGRNAGSDFPVLNQTLFVNADSFQVQMNKDTLCLGDTAQLQAYGSGADQFLWTLPDGTAAPHLSNDTIANPLCFSDTTITYRVVGIARNCIVDRFDTNFITVPVIAPSSSQAQIELLNGSLPLCFGDTVTFVFSASSTNATWLSPTSASDTLFIATADTVILEGTARCSTPVYDTVIVDTAATTMLSTSKDTAICQGDTITISVSGSNQAQWQSNAFLSDTTLANPLAFPPVDTIFVATTSLPCTQNDTVRVNVNPSEQIELSPDSILLCKDTSLTISATTNFQNLEWFPPQWVENSTANPARVVEGLEGWLTVNTSNRNCSTSDSIFVNTINPVKARASAEVLLTCEGYTVQAENASVGASNYSWRLNGREISTGVETEILNYNGQVITLLANNGECVDSTQLFISLDSAISSEVQPINVFTPNGDGVNEYFELRDEQFIHCSDLKVFTRWGQQVYDSNGMPPRWDGRTFGGEELPTGYYFYTLTVNNQTFTGSVWLRR